MEAGTGASRSPLSVVGAKHDAEHNDKERALSKTVKVSQMPNCDICATEDGQPVPAYADAKVFGIGGAPWGYACSGCFEKYNCELGTGKGQILVLQ